MGEIRNIAIVIMRPPIEFCSASRGEYSIVMGTMFGVCVNMQNEMPGSGIVAIFMVVVMDVACNAVSIALGEEHANLTAFLRFGWLF